jgi:hypothetical protein
MGGVACEEPAVARSPPQALRAPGRGVSSTSSSSLESSSPASSTGPSPESVISSSSLILRAEELARQLRGAQACLDGIFGTLPKFSACADPAEILEGAEISKFRHAEIFVWRAHDFGTLNFDLK